MEIIDWIKQGLEKPGKTQTGLATALGRSPSAVTDLLRGKRQIKVQEVEVMAHYLEEAVPSAERKSTAPVMGKIGAGAEIDVGVEQVPPEGYYDIETVVPLPDDVIAFEVVGDSMYPRYDEGDVIICFRKGVPVDQIPDGEEAAVLAGDGRRFLKRVRKTPERGLFNLESHNAKPIFSVTLDWASDVLLTIRADKWRKTSSDDRRHIVKSVKKK